MGKLDRICDIGIEVCILAVLLATPGLWNPWGLNAYELPKVCFLRVMVVAGMALWGVKVFTVHGSRFTVQTGQNGQAGRTGCPRPLLMAVLAFTGAQVLSCLLSLHRYTSLFGTLDRQQGCYTMLCYVGFFFLLCSHLSGAGSDSGRAWRILAAAVLGSVWVCGVGLAEAVHYLREQLKDLCGFVWGHAVQTRGEPVSVLGLGQVWRISSTLGNPTFLGAYLILLIPFTIPLFWRSRGSRTWGARFAGWGLGLLAAAQLVCLYLTGSRGPWLGLAAALVFFAVVMGLRLGAWRLLAAACAVPVLVAALVVVMNTENPLRSPLSRVPYLDRFGFVDEALRGEGQDRVRPLVWKATLRMVTRPPSVGLEPDKLRTFRPLVGWGQDMMPFAFQAVFPPQLEDYGPGRRLHVDRAHNVFLDAAAATGLTGLLAYVGVLATSFTLGLRRCWRAAERDEQLLLTFALAAIFGHLVEAQFGIVLTGAQTLFWLALAMVAVSSAHRPASQEQEGHLGAGWRLRVVCVAILGSLLFGAAAIHAGTHLAADTIGWRAWRGPRGPSAIGLLDRAIRLAPNYSFYRFVSGEVCRQTALKTPAGAFKLDLFKESVRAFQAAIALQPFYANYHAATGHVYGRWSFEFDASKLPLAIDHYEKALKLSPNNVDMRDDLAQVLLDAGRPADALAQVEKSAAIDPGYKRTQRLLAEVRKRLSGDQRGP